jgi:predicted P-loop ATPase
MSKLDAIVNSTDHLIEEIIDEIKGSSSRISYTDAELRRMGKPYGLDTIQTEAIVNETIKRCEALIGYGDENTYNQMKALIKTKYRIIFNEVLVKHFYKARNTQKWELFDSAKMIDYLKGVEGFKGNPEKDIDTIVKATSEYVNPIKEYFQGLPKWDGKDHLKTFTDCFDTDDAKWFYDMMKKNLVRTIKCAFEADYENRYLFIFVGGQQSGKTKAIQFLNPFYEDRGYGKYHNHNPIKMGEKDAIIQSSKCFFWNIDEFEVLRGKEISHLKSIISQGNTTIRPAYGKHEIDIIRRCTYFASTNRSQFLSDDENTRYLCVGVTNNKSNQIRWREYEKMGVDKIWTQIYALYTDPDFRCELDLDDIARQDEKNKQYNVITYVSEIMEKLYEPPVDGKDVEYLGLVDVKKEIEAELDEKYVSHFAIRDAAGQIGLPFKQFRVDGKNIGQKFAIKRITIGSSDYVPTPAARGKWNV